MVGSAASAVARKGVSAARRADWFVGVGIESMREAYEDEQALPSVFLPLSLFLSSSSRLMTAAEAAVVVVMMVVMVAVMALLLLLLLVVVMILVVFG